MGISGAASRSVSWWAKPSDVTKAGSQFFFGWGENVVGKQWGAFIGGTNDASLYVHGSNHDTGYEFEDDKWVHIVLTYDGTDIRTYIDGSLFDVYTYALNTGTVETYLNMFVNFADNYNNYDGIIDEFMITTDALTKEQVREIYNEQKIIVTGGLNETVGQGLAYADLPTAVAIDTVAYYSFEDNLSTSNVVDEKGVNDGTASVNTNTMSSEGKVNNAFELDGSTNYMDMGSDTSIDNLFSSGGTITGWINSYKTSADGMMAMKAANWGGVDGYMFFTTHSPSCSNNKYRLAFMRGHSGSARQYFYTDCILDYNEWHMVGVTIDYSTFEKPIFWVDGQEVNRNEYACQNGPCTNNPDDSSYDLEMGAAWTGSAYNSYFEGKMDEFLFADRKLTVPEIQDLYNAGNVVIKTREELNYTFRTFYDPSPEGYDNLPSSVTGNILSYYKLDETSGTTVTDAEGNTDGTNNGATVGATGILNNAYDFVNSENDYIDTNQQFPDNTYGSFSVWVKPDISTNTHWIISDRSGSGGYMQLTMEDIYQQFGLRISDGAGGQDDLYGSHSYEVGKWHHLVATWGEDGLKLYVNGMLSGSIELTNNPNGWTSNSNLLIGDQTAFTNTIYNFDGLIDEVIISDKVFTEDEVREIFNAQKAFVTVDTNFLSAEGQALSYDSLSSGITSKLDSYWKFDTGATDAHGSNDGTVNGAILTTNSLGKINEDYLFDGIDDYIDFGDVLDTGTGAFTAGAWIRTSYTANWQQIIGKSAAQGNPSWEMRIYSQGGGVVDASFRDGSGVNVDTLRGVTDVTDGNWHFVVLTRPASGGTVKLYVDGLLEAETTNNQRNTDNSFDLTVGKTDVTDLFYFRGHIDEVFVMQDEITEAEILEMYNRPTQDEIHWYYGNSEAETTESAEETFLEAVNLWNFDTGTGELVRRNSAINNGATKSSGYVGGAYDFEYDTKDYMRVFTDDDDYHAKPFTYLAFVKPETLKGDNVVWGAGDNSPFAGARWGLGSNDKIRLSVGIGSWQTQESTGTINPAGEWTHIASSYDNSDAKFYIDGLADTTYSGWSGAVGDVGYAPAIADCMYNNNPCQTTLSFDGIIDELLIFDRAITPHEVYEFSTMSDQTDTLILGAEGQDVSRGIVLITPENNSFFNTSTISFQCNCIVDQDNCTQVNMTIDDALVNTTSGTGNLNLTYTGTVSEGEHNWTCTALNQTGDLFNTTYRYFEVDTTAPVVTITAPADGFTITDYNQSFQLNWTLTEDNPAICWYNFDSEPDVITSCFQESANESNQTGQDGDCNQRYFGDYNITAGSWSSFTNMFDGNQSTYGHFTSGGTGYFYINYSKPSKAVGAIWNITERDTCTGNYNVTIPDSCFNYHPTRLILRISSNTGTNGADPYCYDGAWQQVIETGCTNQWIYEESIHWQIDETISDNVFVNCSLNTTTVNYPVPTPENTTLSFYATDIVNFTGFDAITLFTSRVAPNITRLFPPNGTVINNFNETINIFFNVTGNNTQEDANITLGNCSLGYFTTNFPTTNPLSYTVYMYANDSLSNVGTDIITFLKNTQVPNITIFEPFTTYDSIDIGESLNLKTSITSDGDLDRCWYSYPNPWNGAGDVTNPLSQDLFDNNDSTYDDFFDYNFYFNKTAANLTYRGADCSGAGCSDYFNLTIDTSSCSIFDEYNIKAADIAAFGCDRQLNITCGGNLLYTVTQDCLAAPYNQTVDIYPSNAVSLQAFDNAIEFTCGTNTTFPYELGQNTVYVYANDTLSNFNNVNRSWVSIFNIADQTYEEEILVSESNDFRLDVITTANNILNPYLVYGGQQYPATLNIVNATNFYVESSVITYENMTGNNSFYWNVTLDGTEFSSTPEYQNVSDLSFSICNGINNVTYFRVNFIDESTSSPLSSTIRTSTFVYHIDDAAAAKTYEYGVTTNSTVYEFCFSPSTETIEVVASISYNSDGYPERTTGIENTFNNVSTNLTLSLLGVDAGIYPQITFIDSTTRKGLSGVTYSIYDGEIIADQGVTGSSGSISPYVNPNIRYSVDWSKSGYGSYSDTETFTSITREYLFELSPETFEVDPELLNGLLVEFYPPSGKLENDTDYSFGFFASEGEVSITAMRYTIYDQDDNFVDQRTQSQDGNMTQTIVNTYSNETMKVIFSITGSNGETKSWEIVYPITNFQSKQYSLDDWGMSFDSYFPAATRTTLTRLIWFIVWFVMMLGAFTFGYNGSFKRQEDYANNIVPQTRGNTATGLIFAFLVTVAFSYFNLIPAPFIAADGAGLFSNGILQQNFFATLILIVLIWDLFGASLTKHFRSGN